MEPTLDNRMIFGGLGNLRLAPHVREGRGVSSVSPSRHTADPAASTVAASRPSGTSGFVGAERLTISSQARAAYETSAAAPASPEAVEPSTAMPAAPARPTSIQAALAAAAYGASGDSADPVAAGPVATPASGPALSTALYA